MRQSRSFRISDCRNAPHTSKQPFCHENDCDSVKKTAAQGIPCCCYVFAKNVVQRRNRPTFNCAKTLFHHHFGGLAAVAHHIDAVREVAVVAGNILPCDAVDLCRFGRNYRTFVGINARSRHTLQRRGRSRIFNQNLGHIDIGIKQSKKAWNKFKRGYIIACQNKLILTFACRNGISSIFVWTYW